MEDKIDEDMEFYKEQSREKGRKLANKMIKKVDKVFVPQKLNPDDAKVIFHPVDFVVFNGRFGYAYRRSSCIGRTVLV
jgi:predicted Holliday junction resolvase-like endonuclease